jgi:hypothetical protein
MGRGAPLICVRRERDGGGGVVTMLSLSISARRGARCVSMSGVRVTPAGMPRRTVPAAVFGDSATGLVTAGSGHGAMGV